MASSITFDTYLHNVEHIIMSVWYQAVIFIVMAELLPVMFNYVAPVYQ